MADSPTRRPVEYPSDADVGWWVAQAVSEGPVLPETAAEWVLALGRRVEVDREMIRMLEGIVGRRPTDVEQALAVHMMRTGRGHRVVEVMQGGEANGADAMNALRYVCDLLEEKWKELEPTHQAGVRSQLRDALRLLGGANEG